MRPTKTNGICGGCREMNPYTEINCARCGERLAWAFLIDENDEEDLKPPIKKFIERLFHLDQATPKYDIRCRFCNEKIQEDEKICPHCGKWLASADVSVRYGELVDPEAPEIQRLLKAHEWNKTRWG